MKSKDTRFSKDLHTMPQIYKHNAGMSYEKKTLSSVSLEINLFFISVLLCQRQFSHVIFRIPSMTSDT